MKRNTISGASVLIVLLCAALFAEEAAQTDLPPKEDFHIFLLAGQSNMAGRGLVTEEHKTIHPRVFALSKSGEWVPAMDPIHYDKKVAGLGLGKSFAVALAERDKDVTIGLIPAACGGSPIASWEPGGYHDQTKSHPYDDALKRARRAQQDGTLRGILWHQGESDSKAERAEAYRAKLRALIARFRSDLAVPSVPFFIGQLGQFSINPWNDAKVLVDAAQRTLAREMPLVGFVSAQGLTCKLDKIHFDAPSLREFGRRYAEAYLEMTQSQHGRKKASHQSSVSSNQYLAHVSYRLPITDY